MWTNTKIKLNKLKSLDRELQLFGAENHRYRLNPVLHHEEINKYEEQLGFALPDELLSFYTVLGNGVAGPHNGLFPLNQIVDNNSNKPYQGVAYFKKIAEATGTYFREDYFEIKDEEIHGLITIIDEGCGHEIRLVSNGENIGNVVYVSGDGFVKESNDTLFTIYERWLEISISAFEEVEKLLNSDLTMVQIHEKIKDELNRFDGRDLAISLMGIKKPKNLFGSRNIKRFHGATQIPWYEEQLRNYRIKNNSSRKSRWKFW